MLVRLASIHTSSVQQHRKPGQSTFVYHWFNTRPIKFHKFFPYDAPMHGPPKALELFRGGMQPAAVQVSRCVRHARGKKGDHYEIILRTSAHTATLLPEIFYQMV